MGEQGEGIVGYKFIPESAIKKPRFVTSALERGSLVQVNPLVVGQKNEHFFIALRFFPII
jgi:hypothetical protein